MPVVFNSSLGVQLAVRDVIAEIVRFMTEAPERHYKITVGTDSLRLADQTADFVTAIVVHRVGNGGRYFWRRVKLGKFHTLRDRIIREVLISLDFGKAVLAELQRVEAEGGKLPEWDFEIHADVGEHGPTKALIQEVVGMIRGMNFEPITKPGSYAASTVADRYV